MKVSHRVISLLLVICVMLSLSACLGMGNTDKKKFVATDMNYFDTVATLIGYEQREEDFLATRELVFSRLGEYHRLYDIYNHYEGVTNLYDLNAIHAAEHKELRVDQRIIDLLLFSKEMYTLTNGQTNVAMGSVLSLWHDCREVGTAHPERAELPSEEELSRAAEHTDIDAVVINEDKGTVFISDPAVKIDVGAIAKGYAVEMIARELEDMGISGYTLNVGGNVRTIGSKPDGTPWAVGAENPDTESDEPYIAILSLSGESFVTSGSYQRYYYVNGKSYHHIIDPDTLHPAEGYLSVSVIAPSSALADALSTALFASELEWGMELVGGLSGVEALWVSSDGTQHTSDGFENYLREN